MQEDSSRRTTVSEDGSRLNLERSRVLVRGGLVSGDSFSSRHVYQVP